jgi:diaminopimelate epimerase
VDFRYRIFNADGGEVGQCGNGARCFARFVRDQGLIESDRITVSTRGGVLQLQIHPDGRISVAMGVPRFEPSKIPLLVEARSPRYTLTLDGKDCVFGAVSMGNPHAVLIVDDVERAPLRELGPRIERHPLFPEGVNVGFMQIVDRSRIRLRVFERGVGETLACGSGACAAVAVGHLWGRLDADVAVELPGGELDLHWPDEGEQVIMTGPVVRVFEGEIEP